MYFLGFRSASFRPTDKKSARKFRCQFRNQSGQGLIEYLIIVALMGVATIAIVRVMGESVSRKFASITYALNGQKKPLQTKIDDSVYKKKDLGSFLNGVGGKSEGASGSAASDSEGAD